MKNNFNALFERGYSFEMGRYLSDGWSLFARGSGNFIGFLIMLLVINIVLSFLAVYVPYISFVTPFLSNTLLAGMFVFCRSLTKNHHEFGDFFQAFSSFGQLFLFQIIVVLAIIPIGLIFAIVLGIDNTLSNDFYQPGFDKGYLFEDLFRGARTVMWLFIGMFLLGIYISTSLIFAIPLIVDAKLNFWKAIVTSWKIVGKKFFGFLALMLMLTVGSIILLALSFTLGVAFYIIVFLVMLFVLMPYVVCIIFAAYDRIFTPYMDDLQSQLNTFGGNDTLENEDSTSSPEESI